MSSGPARNATRGLLAQQPRERSRLALAIDIYRSNAAFRGLVDFSVMGWLALAFSATWSGGSPQAPATSSRPAAASTASASTNLGIPAAGGAPTFSSSPGQSNQGPTALARAAGFGELSYQSAAKFRLISTDIEDLKLRPVLDEVNRLLDQRQPDRARELLDREKEDSPSLALMRGIVLAQLGGDADHFANVQRELRKATERAVPAAFTAMGVVQLRALQTHQTSWFPLSALQSVDSTGQAHKVTAEQLAAEMLLWFERGAALARRDSMRFLGLSEARGLRGRINLAAAAAHWRDAATRGDDISAFELGEMYLYGRGVEADAVQATQWLRQASSKGIEKASLLLAGALIGASKAGDVSAADEAMRELTRVAEHSRDQVLVAFAYYLRGEYMMRVAPAVSRNPAEAVRSWEAAASYGFPQAMFALAEAYATGLGAPQDFVRARAALLAARRIDGAAADARLATIDARLTPEQKALAEQQGGRIRGWRKPRSIPDPNAIPPISSSIR